MRPWCNASTWASRPTGSTRQRSARRHPLPQPFCFQLKRCQLPFCGGPTFRRRSEWKQQLGQKRITKMLYESNIGPKKRQLENENRKRLQWILLDHFLLCRRCSSFGLHRCRLWWWRHGHLKGTRCTKRPNGLVAVGLSKLDPKIWWFSTLWNSIKSNAIKDFPWISWVVLSP